MIRIVFNLGHLKGLRVVSKREEGGEEERRKQSPNEPHHPGIIRPFPFKSLASLKSEAKILRHPPACGA